MIVLKFLSDTPLATFTSVYRLAVEIYEDAIIRYEAGRIIIEIYERGATPEDIEKDLAEFGHWIYVEEADA